MSEILIREAVTKKQQKAFVDFPLKLYQDNPYFVPPLYADEKMIFSRHYHYYDTSEAVYYLAYRDGEVVGRISGILQKAANEKWKERRVRFTRFDAIDDQKVADALFQAVEKWALEKGMDTVCGPLGFSDLEREGLLIEGFDQLSTFEEQYSAPYYQRLIENCGYVKDTDWLERKIYPAGEKSEQLDWIAQSMMKRYNLHLDNSKHIHTFIRKYGDQFFELVDKSYANLYGTVPITENAKRELIKNFILIVRPRYVSVLLDENDRAVCFGLCFPSISKAVQPSMGHLTPGCLVRILKAIRKPEVVDLGLIGVDPSWANRGISVVMSALLDHLLRDNHIEHAETNLNLEDNFAIRNQWKRFHAVEHKRRRSFVKQLKP